MMKNLNMKNIKNQMEILKTDDEKHNNGYKQYNDFFNSLHNLYLNGFIDWEMWKKIFEYDDKLFIK